VSHEFGHHVVYDAISNTARKESVMLHEGLADFFTQAKSGNSCLGPSVCPENSPLPSCKLQESRCLRSAENNLRYNDELYSSPVFSADQHLQSLVLSGFLWDLRTSGDMPTDLVSSYAFEALSYVPHNANVKNYMAALFYTDTQHGGTYRDLIQRIAEDRGISAQDLGINLADLPPSIGTPTANRTETPMLEKNLHLRSVSGCTISDGQDSNSTDWWVLGLLFFAPLALTCFSNRFYKEFNAPAK
jgi:hypothetical protein